MRLALVLAVLVLGRAASSVAVELKPETLSAWNLYVTAEEARLDRELSRAAGPPPVQPEGDLIAVPSGCIHRWVGEIFLPGVTLDRVLNGLMYPGTPPPQDEVVASRVLGRTSDSLRVYVRLVRNTVVTVTYDTEHDMTFRRRSPTVATSRSVSTRIVEAGGDDHGFLWRLNSYWRYSQANGGVMVELESLTLSRDLPSLLRPIAAPLINRVARESMTRTLEALRRQFDGSVTPPRWP